MTALSPFLILLLVLAPSVQISFKYEDFREEDVIGLQQFLGELDEDTRELIVELLEAKQNPNSDDQERLMRHIMRKQSIDTLDNLVQLYRDTASNSAPVFCSAIVIIPMLLILL